MSSLWRFCAAVGVCYLAGAIGFVFVGSSLSDWYPQLVKPPLTPSDSIFFPVWMVLYFLMGVALWFVWKKTHSMHGWVRCFLVSLMFNAAWSVFFFGYHSTLIAFMDLISLDFIIIALAIGAWEIDRRATTLLMPYLAWILYASYLSAGLWWLNF